MKKVEAKVSASLYPNPQIIVSCRDKEGKNNALVVGYCGRCSYDPPMIMVGIVPSRYSYHMIKETGCFVAHLVSKEQKAMFDYLGSHTGRDEDKFAALNIQVEEGEKVNAPIIADCPVSMECTVVDSIMTGSHEMFVGKIECVHADASVVKEDGKINFAKLDLIP